ncbi:MAG: RagB/SusD family nutrient uptake outer membrane protein, partial [Bacteroidota bacterium]
FLRALSYYHALDLFRNVPFVTEEDAVGAFFPEQIQANDLFDWIEAELLAVEDQLIDARQNEYGRADKAAAWMLLAKLYLNAEVYTGGDRSADALTYSKRVIDAGYSLEPDYANLYVADNDQSPEAIFSILFDGVNTRTWGGMTFITHAAVGGSMDPAAFGLDGGWGGTRTTSALVNKFPSVGGGGVTVNEAVTTDNEYDLINVPGKYQEFLGFGEWDPENDATALAKKGDDNVFEGFLHFIEPTEFKFADGGWDTNWGDSDNDGVLELGGDNLSVAEAGTYRMVVNLDDLSYSVEKVDWGIIGSATPGGWDADTDMAYDAELGAWTIEVALVGGQEIKFRANDDWALNLGDNGPDGILEINGGNIAVARDGVYKVNLFLDRPDYTFSVEIPASDSRAMFFTDGQTLEIDDVTQFTQGYAVTKFKNVTRDGVTGSDLTFPDTDFMLFRLGDAYLMYAEAALRAADAGAITESIDLINELRQRSYGNEAGNIQRSDLDLDFIIDERARELYWEAQRRTDLVRFGLFTGGDYVWPLKGGDLNGTSVGEFRDVFPIPAADVAANPNLQQNSGY